MSQPLMDVLSQGYSATQWALVIGDVMLDRYLWGEAERISAEAPIPVVLLTGETVCPGGAANVAANLVGLGMSCQLLGSIGRDAAAVQLVESLQQTGIQTRYLITLTERPTITKTRVICGHQQSIRLDQESRMPYSAAELATISAAVTGAIRERPAIIVLSDYNKGVLHPEICHLIIAQARVAGIPVLVDPKGNDYDKYRGATAITPNRKEAAQACQMDGHDLEALCSAAQRLEERLELDFLAVTLSEAGIALLDRQGVNILPAMARKVFDVSGAGDTVIATLAAGLVGGLTPLQALMLANHAAGIVVGKIGTTPIQKAELLQALQHQPQVAPGNKVMTLEALLAQVRHWHNQDEHLVFTNGCFDLLHAGHVTYLEQARQLGSKLIVGLNTDRSVQALKGSGRPVTPEQDRARILAALEAVDAVVLFDEDTPLQLIQAIRPQVLVKGKDYREETVVGAREVKSWGGRVALMDLVEGRSTTRVIEKMAGK